MNPPPLPSTPPPPHTHTQSEEEAAGLRQRVAEAEAELAEERETHEGNMQATVAKAKEKIKVLKDELQAATDECGTEKAAAAELQEVCPVARRTGGADGRKRIHHAFFSPTPLALHRPLKSCVAPSLRSRRWSRQRQPALARYVWASRLRSSLKPAGGGGDEPTRHNTTQKAAEIDVLRAQLAEQETELEAAQEAAGQAQGELESLKTSVEILEVFLSLCIFCLS